MKRRLILGLAITGEDSLSNFNKHNNWCKASTKIYQMMGLLFPQWKQDTGLIPGLRPANERRCYKVTASLIGWAQTWNQPWGYQELQKCSETRPVQTWPVLTDHTLDSFTVSLHSPNGWQNYHPLGLCKGTAVITGSSYLISSKSLPKPMLSYCQLDS